MKMRLIITDMATGEELVDAYPEQALTIPDNGEPFSVNGTPRVVAHREFELDTSSSPPVLAIRIQIA